MNDHDRAEQLHSLRNAVNTACVSLDVGLKLLERNERERATEFLHQAEQACHQCMDLLRGVNQLG